MALLILRAIYDSDRDGRVPRGKIAEDIITPCFSVVLSKEKRPGMEARV